MTRLQTSLPCGSDKNPALKKVVPIEFTSSSNNCIKMHIILNGYDFFSYPGDENPRINRKYYNDCSCSKNDP
jgi:hypothetical protein